VALSKDQKAMLRLLAQREQGYEDIGALMGLSVEQVRARVKEALEEIESEETPAAAPPPPPVPASPPPSSKAVEPPKVEPTPVAPRPTEPKPAPSSPSKAPSPPKLSLPSDRRRLVEWIGGAVVVILIVLFATGAIDLGGGGSDSTTTSAESSPEGGSGTTAANSSRVTKAVLTPVAGGEGAGLALFGKIKKTAVLQVEAKGLKPSAKGQSYTVWLYRSPKLVLRIGAVAVGKSGTIAAQFPIPNQVLAYVAGGAFDQIDVSLTPNAAYEAEVVQAKKQKRLPAYTGKDVLRGRITGPAIQKK
jgi:hypothetical protein